ncbi:MAG: aminopeptidase P family protein [Eubacteriales bacterium]|nr:aminopeptidase P family protein [Eubacteriales bacterium]
MDKIKQLQQSMPEAIEALWVDDPANRFYLTGMRSSAGAVLVTRKHAWLIIDFRYFEEAEAKVHNCVVLEQKELFDQTEALCTQDGIKRLSLLSSRVSVQRRREIGDKLPSLVIDDSDEADRLVERMRSKKDSLEAQWHREAQRITDETFTHICGFIKPGLTEIDIAQEIGTTLTRLGSDDKHFNFIVASGRNSSLPHGFATAKKVEAGDLITMDFGAVVNGRLADMTRTVALGPAYDEQRKIYEAVLEAQKIAMERIKPGAVCREVDWAARGYLYSLGYEGCFSHGLGHSVGVEVHESPRFSETDEHRLEAGYVMTVEPGVYLKQRFGVRIEDMILITDNGFENFTKSDKRLLVL